MEQISKKIALANPFGAPVYHEERLSSTMDAVRLLARDGAAHGTVICADFQDSGRGRLGRPWKTQKGEALMFSIFLNYPDFSLIPGALTLKTGLAVSLAIEDFVPALSGLVQVKWPNDVMLHHKKSQAAKKAVGILAEAEDAKVYLGIGVNLVQRHFPQDLRDKAGSLLSAFEEHLGGFEVPPALLAADAPQRLLEMILFRLYGELEEPQGQLPWKTRLEERLYKRGERVSFAIGKADSTDLVHGLLAGVGEGGELLIIPQGETEPRPFITGELRVY